MQQLEQPSQKGNVASTNGFLRVECSECWDSRIAWTLYGAVACKRCADNSGPMNPAARRVRDAVLEMIARGAKVEAPLLDAARLLSNSSFKAPVPGAVLQGYLDCDRRRLSDLMKQLRDDWHLPVCATRQKPTGYYIAATAEEFLEWMRMTRSQAISELATAYHLFKTNFPELAGQQTLDFVNGVTADLQEAIR